MMSGDGVRRCALAFVVLVAAGCNDTVGAGREYVHSWGDNHWSSFDLSPTTIDTTGTAAWNVAGRVNDWAALGTPIQPQMTTADADVTVRERNMPFYLGLAQIHLDGTGHIVEGRVTLNPVLLSAPYTPAAAQHVACQELGHIWGLDHQVASSCMDDCSSAGTYSQWLACINSADKTLPDSHDQAQLEAIYDHIDGSGDGGGEDEGGGGPPCSKNPDHPRCTGAQDGWITVHVFPGRF